MSVLLILNMLHAVEKGLIMRRFLGLFAIVSIVAGISLAPAQPPARPDGDSREVSSKSDLTAFIHRMLSFDANKDGQLSGDEVIDARLKPLFGRADANHDGLVTRDELSVIFENEFASNRRTPDRDGPGGPGGPGGRGGPPRLGEILPPHVKEMLNLSSVQLKKLDALQKQVDSKLEQILTEEQNQQLLEIRRRGPGGEPRRPGAPGGRPDEFDGPRRPPE